MIVKIDAAKFGKRTFQQSDVVDRIETNFFKNTLFLRCTLCAKGTPRGTPLAPYMPLGAKGAPRAPRGASG